MTEGIVSRGIQKVRKMLSEHSSTGVLSERQLALIREQLKECAVGLGGEVSARQRAALPPGLSRDRSAGLGLV